MRSLDTVLTCSLNLYDPTTKLNPEWLHILQDLNRRSNGLAWLPEDIRFYTQPYSNLMVLNAELAERALKDLDINAILRSTPYNQHPGLQLLDDANPFTQLSEKHRVIYREYQAGAKAMESRISVMAQEADVWAAALASSPRGRRDLVWMCFQGVGRILAAMLGFSREESDFLGETARLVGITADPFAPGKEKAGNKVLEAWDRYYDLLNTPEIQQGVLGIYIKDGKTHGQIMERVIWLITVGIENAAGTLYRLLLRLKESEKQLSTLTALQDNPSALLARCQLAVHAGLHMDAAVGFIMRLVTQNRYTLGDIELSKDTVLLVMPNVVQNPDDAPYDIDLRGKKRLCTFGAGVHWCPGEPVAKLVVSYLLSSFIRYGLFDRLVLSPHDKITPLQNAFFLTPWEREVAF